MKSLALPLLFVGLLLAAFAAGRCSSAGGAGTPPGSDSAPSDEGAGYTCPMHPQIVVPAPVPCPVCGMDLVPFDPSREAGEDRIRLSAEAVALARVDVSEVRRQPVEVPVELVGTAEIAEDARRTIAATIPGRIDRLFVNTTGMLVRGGDHLYEIFSPELLTAQEELLAAARGLEALPDDAGEFLRRSAETALEGAREKLALWRLTPDRISSIEEAGVARARVQIDAPFGGTVLERLVEQGSYVEQGQPAFVLADLTRVWLELEAYELDLVFLTPGQRVEVSAEALPGELFVGTVSFVDPVLDRTTRTASVRVLVENAGGALKPGMFVRAAVYARLDARGRARSTDLAGKWVSPMHPEVVSDEPGTCTVCGMDLVPAEELGWGIGGPFEDPLVVPREAVLWTGRRSLVYAEVESGLYEAREVVLGPRAGDAWIVLGGLEPGTRVVGRGSFRIDSEMQIRGKASMLARKPGPEGPDNVSYSAQHDGLWQALLEFNAALAADDFGRGAEALAAVASHAVEAEGAQIGPSTTLASLRALAATASDGDGAEGIEELRNLLPDLTASGLELLASSGNRGTRLVRATFCPMALDGAGGTWLQGEGPLANPYYGAAMLRCGEFVREHLPAEQP